MIKFYLVYALYFRCAKGFIIIFGMFTFVTYIDLLSGDARSNGRTSQEPSGTYHSCGQGCTRLLYLQVRVYTANILE